MPLQSEWERTLPTRNSPALLTFDEMEDEDLAQALDGNPFHGDEALVKAGKNSTAESLPNRQAGEVTEGRSPMRKRLTAETISSREARQADIKRCDLATAILGSGASDNEVLRVASRLKSLADSDVAAIHADAIRVASECGRQAFDVEEGGPNQPEPWDSQDYVKQVRTSPDHAVQDSLRNQRDLDAPTAGVAASDDDDTDVEASDDETDVEASPGGFGQQFIQAEDEDEDGDGLDFDLESDEEDLGDSFGGDEFPEGMDITDKFEDEDEDEDEDEYGDFGDDEEAMSDVPMNTSELEPEEMHMEMDDEDVPDMDDSFEDEEEPDLREDEDEEPGSGEAMDFVDDDEGGEMSLDDLDDVESGLMMAAQSDEDAAALTASSVRRSRAASRTAGKKSRGKKQFTPSRRRGPASASRTASRKNEFDDVFGVDSDIAAVEREFAH